MSATARKKPWNMLQGKVADVKYEHYVPSSRSYTAWRHVFSSLGPLLGPLFRTAPSQARTPKGTLISVAFGSAGLRLRVLEPRNASGRRATKL